MTSGIRKFGQREEVPDDWFGGGDDKDQQPRLPPRAELPKQGQEPPKSQGKIRRFFGWIVRPFWPSSRTRLVFLLAMMLAIPIAFDIGNQFVAQNGDRYTVYLVAGAWAFLIGLMAFTFGAVAVGSLSKWERIVVLATAAVAASLHWLYVTTGVKIFDIGYGIEQFQTQKAFGAILLCGTTLIASAGLQRLLRNRETQLLRWGGDVRMNLIAVAIALASIFGIVSLTSGQDFALFNVFRQLNWLGLGVLFALLGVVVPVLVLNYSANLFWLSVWMPVCAGWGLAVLSLLFDYFSVDGGMMMGMAFTYGCGILVASFGTYRNRYRTVKRKAWSWPWAMVWNTPVIAAIVALLYINNQFHVPAIYQKNGFQWDMARELGRLNQFATVNYRWGHLDLDFTKNENQDLVSGTADKSLGLPMVSFTGINEKLNLNALPTTGQVSIRRSQVSVEQLASLAAGSLSLENTTISDSVVKAPLIGTPSFYLREVTPGTLTQIIEHHTDPKSILQLSIEAPNLSRSDWESLGKLDPKTQIYLNLRNDRKVVDASDDFGQILQRLPKEVPVWLNLYRNSSNPDDVQFFELIHDLVGTHLNLRWSTDVDPDLIDKSEIEMNFDALFLTNGLSVLELDKLYDAIHDLNPEALSEYHLLYSKSDSVQPNALYLPAAGKFVFDQELASTLESISFDQSWRGGNSPGVIDVELLDEQHKGLVFAAKELYLDGLQNIKVLEMFPNLEILQIAESPMAPWRMKSLVELQQQFKNQTKLKKIIVKAALGSNLLEALGQIKTLEELVVAQEAVDLFGLDTIQALMPKVKITVLKARDDAWIPQHFRDHQQRVFAKLREKYQAKIKAIEAKEEKDKPTTK